MIEPQPQVEIDIDEEIFLECYRHLLDSSANINFLWGGRDSGKSYFIAQKLILDCLQKDYFRCILIKKTAESIKDAQWQTIKDICEQWGIDHLFTFKTSPLEIVCVNGNKFIARGCDKPEKLKSISNPSHAWYEEGNQLTEADYIVATTTLRSQHGPVQEWFSFNPECEGDYEDFWLFRSFFKENYDKNIMTFNSEVEFSLPDGKKFVRKFTSTHRTYHDNLQYCSPDRIANHESLRKINAYYYKVFTEGLWGKRIQGGEFYKCFSASKHAGKTKYNPLLPLHISFDENVNPYFPCGIFQIVGKKIMMVDEILGRNPNNTVKWVCSEIVRKYQGHTAGMFIYGDATSQKDDVKLEKGYDLYRLIIEALSQFKASRRVSASNPSVVMRGNFINTILEINFRDIEVIIGDHCKEAIRDFENTKEASDGTKDKKTTKDEMTGVSYQKHGHMTDLTDYLICYAFANEYVLYQNGNKQTTIQYGSNKSKSAY